MGGNLEEFKLLEKIKISYLRNRGQVIVMAKELELDLNYVKKMVAKFKKRDNRDTSFWVADALMGHIMSGHHQRVTHLDEMLRSLDRMEQPLLSICCSNPVRKYPDDDPAYAGRYECLFHHAPCEVHIVNMLSVYRLKMQLLDQLGLEEERLVGMAVKMGFVRGEITPPSTLIKAQQNIVVLPGQDGKRIIEDYSKLSPMDRDRLIDKLKEQITAETVPQDALVEEEKVSNETTGVDTVPRNNSE